MRKVRKSASGNREVGELTLFSVLGVIACGISFFAYWWLAAVGLLFGARGWLLSYRKSAQQLEYVGLYRALSALATIVGAAGVFATVVG